VPSTYKDWFLPDKYQHRLSFVICSGSLRHLCGNCRREPTAEQAQLRERAIPNQQASTISRAGLKQSINVKKLLSWVKK
jgi:hypothetical protein